MEAGHGGGHGACRCVGSISVRGPQAVGGRGAGGQRARGIVLAGGTGQVQALWVWVLRTQGTGRGRGAEWMCGTGHWIALRYWRAWGIGGGALSWALGQSHHSAALNCPRSGAEHQGPHHKAHGHGTWPRGPPHRVEGLECPALRLGVVHSRGRALLLPPR